MKESEHVEDDGNEYEFHEKEPVVKVVRGTFKGRRMSDDDYTPTHGYPIRNITVVGLHTREEMVECVRIHIWRVRTLRVKTELVCSIWLWDRKAHEASEVILSRMCTGSGTGKYDCGFLSGVPNSTANPFDSLVRDSDIERAISAAYESAGVGWWLEGRECSPQGSLHKQLTAIATDLGFPINHVVF